MAIVVGGPGIYLGGASAPPVPPFVNEYSMTFDGNLDYVNCGNNADFNTNDTVSISVWFKTSDGVTPVQTVVSKVFYRLQIQISSGISRVVWAVYYTGSQLQIITSPITKSYDDGLWHHVLAVYQSNTLGGMSLYIDGNLISTLDTQPQIFTSTNPLLIGARQTSNLLPFNGNIDEVAFWTNNQSANASTIYNGGMPTDLTSLSPLSWWRMGDNDTWNGSTWTLTDNGSGGNDATSVNMEEADRLPISPNSYTQNSFSFDGVDEYFTAGNPSSLQITGALTLSAWVKIASSGGQSQQCIISKNNGSTQRSFVLWAYTSFLTSPIAYIYSGASNYSVQATTNIRDGFWHHVMLVYNPSTSLNIYVDGVLEGSNTTSIPASINNATQNFEIGRFGSGVFQVLGNIDEVAVFNTDQSSNISTIFNNGVPQDISSLSPLSHWRMGESATWNGSTWTLTDQGSGGNNATSVNMEEADKTGDQAYVL